MPHEITVSPYSLDDEEKQLIDKSSGWPITSMTEIDVDCITYHVLCGEGESALWTKIVEFSSRRSNVAGGAAFVRAAREQEAVVKAVREYLTEKGT